MKILKFKNLVVVSAAFALVSCGTETNTNEGTTTGGQIKEQPVVEHITPPTFDSDSAYAYTQLQADMGPRVPGTKAHAKCVDWMSEKLKSYGAEVIVQNGVVTTYDEKKFNAKNVIASFDPKNANRVVLAAHFDSRPICDNDTIPGNKSKACPGVNDGASGVAVLMEIARNIKAKQPKIGVDIIMFDVEDYGEPHDTKFPAMRDSWCLGSQYWSKNPHKPGYYAQYGILLDMVGGKDASFYKEGSSIFYASSVVEKVWGAASRLGYGNYFKQEPYGEFTDDHIYVNNLINIPMIDIINYDRDGNRFFKCHHKLCDDMSNIDKSTLKSVGQTVMEVVWNEK